MTTTTATAMKMTTIRCYSVCIEFRVATMPSMKIIQWSKNSMENCILSESEFPYQSLSLEFLAKEFINHVMPEPPRDRNSCVNNTQSLDICVEMLQKMVLKWEKKERPMRQEVQAKAMATSDSSNRRGRTIKATARNMKIASLNYLQSP